MPAHHKERAQERNSPSQRTPQKIRWVNLDKEIIKGFEKVKKTASKEEKTLVKKDKKRDKKCEHAEKLAKKK